MIEILDYLAMACILVGVYLLSQYANRYGMLLIAIGNLCWIVMSLMLGVYGLLFQESIIFIMNAVGFYRWGKK